MKAKVSALGLRAMALFLLSVPLCVWLMFVAVPANLATACHWKQWPVLPECTDPETLSVEQHIQHLRDQLSSNPGDSLSYAELARFANQPVALLKAPELEVVKAAAMAAPFAANVLQLQVRQALVQSDWPTAVDRLVLLTETYGNTDATLALAVLMARSRNEPDLLQALLAAAQKDQAWLAPVMRAMPGAKIPVSTATPLIGRLAQSKGLTPAFGSLLIKQLKAEGAWLDAHAIWLSLWKKPMGFLFNGDFEQSFIPDAFDWEILDSNTFKAGAQTQLTNNGKHGQVLSINFTGRPFKTPIVRQHLILPPGNYQFTGEFQSSNLQSNQGLAWVFSCGSDQQELARTSAMTRTGRGWEAFNMDFQVGSNCGSQVTLSLQPQAAYEAKTGQHGEMLFDRFTLNRK